MSPVQTRLAVDAELWVIEALLFSAQVERIEAHLVTQGLTAEQAHEQVQRLHTSGGLQRLRDRLATARRAEGLDRLRRSVDPAPPTLPVAETVDSDTLWREHWVRSRPLHLPGWARDFAPVRRWTFEALGARFGDVPVEVNVDRLQATTPDAVERHQATMPFATLLARAQGHATDDVYAVSRNGLLAQPGLAPLWSDLLAPPAPLAAPAPPRGVALWLGPAGTHTRPHYDPHHVVLIQVQGRKRVRLAPPPPPEAAAGFDGWYLRGPLAALEPLEVVLGPGDALFLPAAWLHEVHALEPSITLSWLAFDWPNHFHFLGPPGADDV